MLLTALLGLASAGVPGVLADGLQLESVCELPEEQRAVDLVGDDAHLVVQTRKNVFDCVDGAPMLERSLHGIEAVALAHGALAAARNDRLLLYDPRQRAMVDARALPPGTIGLAPTEAGLVRVGVDVPRGELVEPLYESPPAWQVGVSSAILDLAWHEDQPVYASSGGVYDADGTAILEFESSRFAVWLASLDGVLWVATPDQLLAVSDGVVVRVAAGFGGPLAVHAGRLHIAMPDGHVVALVAETP